MKKTSQNQSMSKIWKNLEHGFTILSLMIYSGGILTLLVSGGFSEGEDSESSGDDDNALTKQIFLLIYFITAILLALRWKKFVYVVGKNKWFLLFITLATVSINWSYSPERTISRVIALLGTTLFGLYLASRYTFKQQMQLLVWTFATIVLLSMLFIVVLPKYGIMGGSHSGAWRGIYNHKNVLGKMMVMSTAIMFLQFISYKKKELPIFLGLTFSIILLVMSKSSSALINLLIVLVLFLIFRTWRWRFKIMIPMSLAIIILFGSFFIWFTNNSDFLFAAVGKDPSLTGRTDLWFLLFDKGFKKPWFGYGYGAFWWGFKGASADIWYLATWHPPNSHNGFLDLWLSLGFIGLFTVILNFSNTVSKAFIWLRYSKTPYDFWPLLFMGYFILTNLTESALMIQNDVFTVIYIAISYSLTIEKPISNDYT